MSTVFCSRQPLPVTLLLLALALPCLKSESFFVSDLDTIGSQEEAPLSSAYHALKSNSLGVDLEQFILFSVGDKENYKGALTEDSSFFRQDLNQTTVNYCDFDPKRLSRKLKGAAESAYRPGDSVNVKQNVDIIVKGAVFNASTAISVRIQFLNKQAQSQQLWYLLEAKSVCTNRVVGTWRLSQQAYTETIFCFNRDDTVFGHRSDKSVTSFDQIWLPTNTNEDIYFVLAVFTDEAYALTSPYYSIISSPIIKYETYSLIADYAIKCAMPTLNTKQELDTFQFETLDTMSSKNEENQMHFPSSDNNGMPRIDTPELETTKIVPAISEALPTQATSQATTSTTNVFSTSTGVFLADPIGSEFSEDRSMFIHLVGQIFACEDLNQNLALDVKSRLELLYKNVTNFKEVKVIRISSKSCAQSVRAKAKRARRAVSASPAVTIEHYCLFSSPTSNKTKMSLVKSLQEFLASSQQIGNGLVVNEAFVLKNDGKKVNLNDSCAVFDYLQLCQNKGICYLKQSTPTCLCIPKTANESFYWSGDYCDYKIYSPSTSDQIKMIITVATLGAFAIASLIALILYIIYKRRQQKEIIKRSSSVNLLKCVSTGSFLPRNSNYTHESLTLRSIPSPIMTISNKESSRSASSYLTNDTSVLSYISNGVFSYAQIYDGNTSPEFPSVDNSKLYEKRHSFSVRNTLSARSTDSFAAYMQSNQLPVSKNSVVCITDGSSTSFRPIIPVPTPNRPFVPRIFNTRNNCRSDNFVRKNFRTHFCNGHFGGNDRSEVLSEKSKVGLKHNNLSSPNYIDYPRINGFADPNLRTIAYPKDVIIASPPKSHFPNPLRRSKPKESKKSKGSSRHATSQPAMAMESRGYAHVNYAFDNERAYESLSPPQQQQQQQSVHARSQDDLFQCSSSQTCSEQFLVESQFRGNLRLGRKESAQHIPHSFERHMAKNFQALTTNSSPTGTCSLDTSIEASNQNSKCTDSTSVCTDSHSLKDEDAWLPILNIAEEEILKYQALEASKITEYCLI